MNCYFTINYLFLLPENVYYIKDITFLNNILKIC